jgi:hypothetical protein
VFHALAWQASFLPSQRHHGLYAKKTFPVAESFGKFVIFMFFFKDKQYIICPVLILYIMLTYFSFKHSRVKEKLMKKLFVLLFSVLLFSGNLLGEDIKTLDGKIYKKAEVLNTMPDGLLINYIGKDGFNTVQLLKFSALPVSIQKKYGYNQEKAASFENEHNKWLNKQQAIEKEKMAKYKARQRQEKLNAKTKQADNASVKQQTKKEKLNSLVNSLEKMSDNNKKQPTGSGELSVGNLVHDAVSSTEDQVKEINNLSK